MERQVAPEPIVQSSVVIVSHQFWQSRLGGRADVIGQTITLDERPHIVIGVLRPDYRHPEAFFDRAAEIFLPLPLRADDHRHALRVIGRLQPGVTPEQAQAEMTTIARQLEQAWPQSNPGWGAALVPLAEQRSGKVRRALFVLQGAGGFVLLITCVNLANLLLARVTTRAKELAVRSALGAEQLRLIRLFLSESVWLAVLGGLGGLLLARWCVALLPALAPRELTTLGEVRLDGRVLGFTLLLSLLTLFFFSLAPMWQVSRTSLSEVIKDMPSAPLSGFLNFRKSFTVAGQPAAAPNDQPVVGLRFISPNYFRTMSIPMVAGRSFTEADTATAPHVAIVNQAFVRLYLSGLAPLGQKLLDGEMTDEIVGRVSDFKYESLQTEAEPEIYVPHAQNGFGGMALVVRTRVQPETLTAAVQRAVWPVEKNAVLSRVMTMKQLLSEVTARPRFMLWLLGVFALVALLLTGVGVYGVLAYTVAQSTREMGIRMALGAEARDMLKLALGQGMVLALLGVGIGLLGALALTRLLKTLLFGVSATDPLTFAGVAALLCVVALLAGWIPARRATKVDPMIALRLSGLVAAPCCFSR
jgi:FtsX-like permease family/MacB-like periplasmic core domain